MFKNYRRRRLIRRLGVPERVDDLWLCGQIFGPTKVEGRTVLMKYFFRGKYVDHRIGDVVKMFKAGNGHAYYRIDDARRWGSDPAPFDDGVHYNLVFDHYKEK